MRVGIHIGLSIPARSIRMSYAVLRLVVLALLIVAAPCCVLLNATDPHVRVTTLSASTHTPVSPATAPPISDPLTLPKAIEIALANNPELAAAGYGVAAAGAERAVALGSLLPWIGVKSGYDHYLDRHRLGPPRYIGEHRVYSDGVFASDVMVRMPLFAGGRLISELKAADLLQAASKHQLSLNRQELVFNISSVYYSILAQHHVIDSLEFSLQTLKLHLMRITHLIQSRKAARVDSLRTEVRIADLEQQLVRERNVLERQIRVLMNFLGVEMERDAAIEVAGELTVDTAGVPQVEEGLAKAVAQRGDYLAMRAALEAQARHVDAARAGRWPALTLQGFYGGRWAAGRVERNGDDSFDDVGSVGVVLDMPIFEGGIINARIRRERAKLAAAQETMRKLELQILLEVETALLNISSAVQRVVATEKSIEQAKESLRIEREKYDFGKGAITDVLDAQSALLDSQMNYYRALADYNTAQAQFSLATGET